MRKQQKTKALSLKTALAAAAAAPSFQQMSPVQ
jgi:hypothetical protein